MKKLEDESVDAVVTDPPYGLEFMGKEWDRLGDIGKTSHSGVPERDGSTVFGRARVAFSGSSNLKCRNCQKWKWASLKSKCVCVAPDFPNAKAHQSRIMQEWHYSWANEALRVLKPGGHLLAFGGTRTYHRLACAIEDAGFEIRDSIHWVYGSGFPKSLVVGKAIDREAGLLPPEAVGFTVAGRTDKNLPSPRRAGYEPPAPATDAAKEWHGWGTALKPSHEIICVARKPLEGTVAQNVQRFGTGALNVDGCRVEGGPRPALDARARITPSQFGAMGGSRAVGSTTEGRWPPNLVLSHSASCGDECAPDCPVAEMDRQSGFSSSSSYRPPDKGGSGIVYTVPHAEGAERGHSDSGGASRFFPCFRYEAKASRAERDEGLSILPILTGGDLTNREDGSAGLNSPRAGAGRMSGGRNLHPTVKPIALMRWLVRLVTPPGGLVLDPFTGSGSTGCAAVAEGMRFIGFESDEQYVEIAKARLDYWRKLGYQKDLF